MQQIPGSKTYVIENCNQPITFRGENDFLRILQEEKFENVYSSERVQIWRPTKPALKGDKDYNYIIDYNGGLVGNVIVVMPYLS